MKVLLLAYACEPNQGSEEGVGWNVACEMAKYYEVWVLTRTFYRDAIESELTRNPIPNLHFIYLDPFGWKEDFRGIQGWVQVHYYLWQIWAYFVAKRLYKEVRFDLTHHVTYVKYWSPSFVSFLPIPFIWGPVGGGEFTPKGFWGDFSLYGKLYEILRYIGHLMGEHDPFVLLTARKSALTLATTEETKQRLTKRVKANNVQIFLQTGLSRGEIEYLAQYDMPRNDPIIFITIGRLLHWKGVHLGIRAFASAKIKQAEYWIVGDGIERRRLETLSRSLGVEDKIRFFGALPREEVLDKLKKCHILVHPSLHDSGGFVCLEAMAAGRPVICLDLGGPGAQVTKESGFKISAHDSEQVVRDMAETMICLANDPELRNRMGKAGQRMASEIYNWEIKGKFFNELYKEILNKNIT